MENRSCVYDHAWCMAAAPKILVGWMDEWDIVEGGYGREETCKFQQWEEREQKQGV